MPHTICLRAETKVGERRTALTPHDAKELIEEGFRVQVEICQNRIFPLSLYKEIGCEIIPKGSWKTKPKQTIILGLKELPLNDFPLIHRHIYFAHVYKNQSGWKPLLRRFHKGHGTLLDLEYLTNDEGRRVAAFGKWAGYVGAGLALDAWIDQMVSRETPLMQDLRPYDSKEAFVSYLSEKLKYAPNKRIHPKILIIGRRGRSGQGAERLFEEFNLKTDGWGLRETKNKGPFPEILSYQILINCALITGEAKPFLNWSLLKRHENRKLAVISDVSCDPNGPYNPIPIYDEITTFKKPIHRVIKKSDPLDLIAIDHLPSLLPKESSVEFSKKLLPHLLDLKEGSPVWSRAKTLFKKKVELAIAK